MSTRDLINAIAAGDALEIENAFNATMAEKVSNRIEDMRIDVAQNLFAEEVENVEEIEEETEFNPEDYSLEEIKSFMQTEEFEQLDELHKSTLKSYMAKVMDNAVNSTDDMSTDKKWKRLIGYHGARRRIQTGNVPKKPE